MKSLCLLLAVVLFPLAVTANPPVLTKILTEYAADSRRSTEQLTTTYLPRLEKLERTYRESGDKASADAVRETIQALKGAEYQTSLLTASFLKPLGAPRTADQLFTHLIGTEWDYHMPKNKSDPNKKLRFLPNGILEFEGSSGKVDKRIRGITSDLKLLWGERLIHLCTFSNDFSQFRDNIDNASGRLVKE